MADTENSASVEDSADVREQPKPQGSYQLRDRQSRLEGSYEQMDKRIDSSDNWVRHHSMILMTMIGIVTATVVVSLIKLAFFTPTITTISNTP